MADVAFNISGKSTGNNSTFSMGRLSTTANVISLVGIVWATGDCTTNAAFTLIDREFLNGVDNTGPSLYVYSHIGLGASEPANFTWNNSTSVRFAWTGMEFSVADTTTPVDTYNSQRAAASTSVVCPSIDPNFTNDMLCAFYASASTAAWTAPTDVGAMVEPAQGDSPAASAVSIGCSYLLLASGAATGVATATATVSAVNAGFLIGVRNASAIPDSTGDTGTVSVGTATASGLTVSATAGVNRLP
jgi:hypothetical protein